MEEIKIQKDKKLFVSHAAKDITYIRNITELLENIGLTEEQMVCSSIPEYGIPLGEDIYEWLSSQFQNCDLHVLFVLSKNYYASVACLNEMGAAWVLKKRYDTILLPGFEFQDIKGAVNANQISIKLDGDEAVLKQYLSELKDNIIKEFGLHMPSASKWERHRDAFIGKIAQQSLNQIEELNEEMEICGERVKLTDEAETILVTAAKDPEGRICVLKAMGGTVIFTNGRTFATPGCGAREKARWSGAIGELENVGLIQAVSYKREMFSVSREGYELANEIENSGKNGTGKNNTVSLL